MKERLKYIDHETLERKRRYIQIIFRNFNNEHFDPIYKQLRGKLEKLTKDDVFHLDNDHNTRDFGHYIEVHIEGFNSEYELHDLEKIIRILRGFGFYKKIHVCLTSQIRQTK